MYPPPPHVQPLYLLSLTHSLSFRHVSSSSLEVLISTSLSHLSLSLSFRHLSSSSLEVLISTFLSPLSHTLSTLALSDKTIKKIVHDFFYFTIGVVRKRRTPSRDFSLSQKARFSLSLSPKDALPPPQAITIQAYIPDPYHHPSLSS
jgi:hypothetical protein